MRKRALAVIAMCVLSMVIGVTRKGAVIRAHNAPVQTVAATEKSHHSNHHKVKGIPLGSDGEKFVLASIKYD